MSECTAVTVIAGREYVCQRWNSAVRQPHTRHEWRRALSRSSGGGGGGERRMDGPCRRSAAHDGSGGDMITDDERKLTAPVLAAADRPARQGLAGGGDMSDVLTTAATRFKADIDSGARPLPEGAREGPWALGAPIMVARASIGAECRNPDLPVWFPARVCKPPADEPGQWYRWYDPYIWYETEGALTDGETEWHAPRNMAYVGKCWYEDPYGDEREFWAYPLDVWRRLFA